MKNKQGKKGFNPVPLNRIRHEDFLSSGEQFVAPDKVLNCKVGYSINRWFAWTKCLVARKLDGSRTHLVFVPRIIDYGAEVRSSWTQDIKAGTSYLKPGEGYEYLFCAVSPMGASFFRMDLNNKFIGYDDGSMPSIEDILSGAVACRSPQSQLKDLKVYGRPERVKLLKLFLEISHGVVAAEEEGALHIQLRAMRHIPLAIWRSQERQQVLGEIKGQPQVLHRPLNRMLALATSMGGYDPNAWEGVEVDEDKTTGDPVERPIFVHDVSFLAQMMPHIEATRKVEGAAGKQSTANFRDAEEQPKKVTLAPQETSLQEETPTADNPREVAQEEATAQHADPEVEESEDFSTEDLAASIEGNRLLNQG